jgi:hypothetical protein
MAVITFSTSETLDSVVEKLNTLSGDVGDMSRLVSNDTNVVDGVNGIRNRLAKFDDSAEQTAIARQAFVVTDQGGLGSLVYSDNTGIFNYTGADSANFKTLLSANNGLTFDDGILKLDSGQVTVTYFAGGSITSSLYASVTTTEIINSAGTTLVTLRTPGT